MTSPESRIESLLEDLEEILHRRDEPANDEPDGYRVARIPESDALRRIRIRLARFRQGY
ncbi:hypothetical protein P6166_04760 [Stenotrophomonas sp. HITSZ_GD]|uniref:hypothetical protein n=1 Tax=Stenotrophomonas sp. HITSZ_GD TaxID=3037248 RepID=UPI00240DA115|nr:hypothetical protein [Stenotrophomonas sp. HITSZ_GD]MDG2524669.1 hypothetical protein [Stenotrophomonas sp. HITSZ_GD]